MTAISLFSWLSPNAFRNINSKDAHLSYTLGEIKAFKHNSFQIHQSTFKTLTQTERLVEWLALMLRIRKVAGSNLGLETGYPD
jgi:hypothetical protein